MAQKIMIVDDEEDTLTMLKDVLETEGYSVQFARDGPECLEKLQEFKPDIILLDIMMPKMNGWVLYLNLQKHADFKKIPVMVVSAKPLTEESRNKVTLLGIKDYIIKPFDLSELILKIKEILH